MIIIHIMGKVNTFLKKINLHPSYLLVSCKISFILINTRKRFLNYDLKKHALFTNNSQFQYLLFKNGVYYIATITKGGDTIMKTHKSSVLACVTDQYDCDRIIKTAKQIADDCGCELRVLSILKPTSNYAVVSDQIEYLNLVAKEAGADMTVLFHTDPPKAAADFVKENNVQRIVTGMHDGGDTSFLVMFNKYAPSTAITMVAKNNMVYSMDLCRQYS